MSDPIADLQDRTSVVAAAVAQWADQGATPDRAAARWAGSTAVDAIGTPVRDLFALPGRLVRAIGQLDGTVAPSRVG